MQICPIQPRRSWERTRSQQLQLIQVDQWIHNLPKPNPNPKQKLWLVLACSGLRKRSLFTSIRFRLVFTSKILFSYSLPCRLSLSSSFNAAAARVRLAFSLLNFTSLYWLLFFFFFSFWCWLVGCLREKIQSKFLLVCVGWIICVAEWKIGIEKYALFTFSVRLSNALFFSSSTDIELFSFNF